MLKKRRAVGGLISLIGIIVVFGIASVAYLELSSSQTSLISTSLASSQKLAEKNNERLNFTGINESGGIYEISIDNIGSHNVLVHSYLVKNANNLVDKSEVNSAINPATSESITTNSFAIDPSSDILIIVTDSGKKCVIPADVSYRIC